MFRIIGAFFALCCTVSAAIVSEALPLVFEPNRGQVDKQVQWLARGPGYTLFLTGGEAVMALRGPAGAASEALRMRLAGSRSWRMREGLEPTGGISNYFLGNDPNQWRTGVPHYRRVKVVGVYEGVDLIFYGNPQKLEYDLVVEPGADPGRIRLDYGGVRLVEVDSDGDLVLTAHSGAELRQQRPRVYQEIAGRKVEVAGAYEIRDGRQVAIQVTFYDHSRPLVIDPVLVYSTYLGGSLTDTAHGLAVDSSGSVYIAGSTSSSNFPVQSGYQGMAQGLEDVFVSKLSPAGNALVYSTYLGGLLKDQALDLAVDSTGAAYVTGYTLSADFPTQSPYQAYRGADDVFVAKLTPAGSALVYSTYLGGSGRDMPSGVVVDSMGAAYVAGATASANFPTASPIETYQGVEDAFVAKLEDRSSPPARPVITEVANAWSGRSPIADAAWVYIKGTGLAETTRTWRGSEIVAGRLPTALDGVSVKINTEDAYVYYVSPTQINVQVPFDWAVGEVPVEVTNAGGKSSSFPVAKEGVAPALFVWFPGTATEGNKYVGAVTSEGQQVIYIGKPGLLSPVGLATRPARPGETVLLFATGCGPTTPPFPARPMVMRWWSWKSAV